MLSVPVEQIVEADIQRLIKDEIEESIRLDYKETLTLDKPKQRLEAAKDVSALANTAGGRIVYGMKEKKGDGPDGIPETVVPLTDTSLPRRLEDILLAAIHPMPRFRMKEVPVSSGGYVLVLEVYPSDFDLHMVDAYDDFRFYVRSEKRSVVMSEPEIRERYVRLAQLAVTVP